MFMPNDADRILAQRLVSAADAICEATDIAMARDSSVYVIGEGVTDPKAIFGTTKGLLHKYGPGRVIESPISENGITGIVIGSALMGQRPLLIHQRVEFALLSMEQLVNNAAKIHYVTQGRHKVPLVVRMIVGRGWGQGPAHSQSLEAMFAYIPGLKVVMPSQPEDCRGLLLAALADDNPVIFLEHRWVHYVTGHLAQIPAAIPLEGPRHLAQGDACTVVATSYMVLECLQAASALADAGVHIDLFDLRVLRPLDTSEIIASVRRTGRLLVIDTGYLTYGVGAEVIARAAEAVGAGFKSPPRRLGLPDHPTPSSKSLAETYYPRSPQIAAAVGEIAGIDKSRVADIVRTLSLVREKLPLDIPHPSFQGPF